MYIFRKNLKQGIQFRIMCHKHVRYRKFKTLPVSKGPFPLSDFDCESDVANNWVLVISMELFPSSDMKHQMKISYLLSQSLSVNGP